MNNTASTEKARFFEPMDIWAPSGTKVRPIYENGEPKNGYPFDIEQVQKHLKQGEFYTVDRTEVHSSTTDVYLKEFPGVRFNSVCLEQERTITQGFLDAADHLAFIAARYATEGNDAHHAVTDYHEAKKRTHGK